MRPYLPPRWEYIKIDEYAQEALLCLLYYHMMKRLFFLLFVFVAGGIGGLFMPQLLHRWIPDTFFPFGDRTIIENKTEQIILGEKETLQKAYHKNRSLVVRVQSQKGNTLLTEGQGFVLSVDGLILTRKENVLTDASSIMIGRGEEKISARIVSSSQQDGLLLLQAESTFPSVASFAPDTERSIGTTVFIMGTKKGLSQKPIPFVRVGSIISIDGPYLETTIQERGLRMQGAPLMALDGTVLGIVFTDTAGNILALSVDAIKSFIKLVP